MSRTNSTLACQRYQNSWKTDCLVEIHYQQNITEEFSAKIVRNPATWYSQRMSSRCWLSFKNNFTCRRLNWSALIQLSLKVLNIYPRRGETKSFFWKLYVLKLWEISSKTRNYLLNAKCSLPTELSWLKYWNKIEEMTLKR